MKRIVVSFYLFLLTSPVVAAESMATANSLFTTNLDLEAREVYVQYFPLDKLLTIREYGLSTLLSDEADIRKQADELRELVTNARYCQTRFGIEGYVAGQEALYDSPANGATAPAAHVECVLVTDTEVPDSMINSFSGVLNRKVQVAADAKEITMMFDSPDLVVGPTNALAILGKDADQQTMIKWRNGDRFFDAVFINRSKAPDAFRSLHRYISNYPISSPVRSKEQIDALRRELQPEGRRR